MSNLLPEGWTQEKIDDVLEFQRVNKIYYCRECSDWVQDLPQKHVCEPLRLMVEKSGNRYNKRS